MHALGFLASLVAPGTLHVARGQAAKGIGLWVLGLVGGWLAFWLLFRTFIGLVAWAMALWGYVYWTARIASRTAIRRRGWPHRAGAAALTVLFPPAVLAAILLASPFQLYRVPTSSMQPTIAPSEIIVVDRLAYRFGTIQRGHVVVFAPRYLAGTELVKRVIAFTGERVTVAPEGAEVDGRALAEPYLPSASRAHTGVTYRTPARVPPALVFVLGDNRRASVDSRTFGNVPVGTISGRACYVLRPTTWRRIGHPL